MRRLALLVGIDDYLDDRIADLRCCARDAQRMAFTLTDMLGFDEAVALTKGVTVDQVHEQLHRMGAQLKPGDLFVFFFAGHGKTHDATHDEADQYLLLPQVDARLLSERALAGVSGILSLRVLKRLTDRWAGVQRLFILDACRLPLEAAATHRGVPAVARFEGAGVFRDVMLRRERSRADGQDAPLTVLNSCSAGERAEELPDHPGGGHGSFTAALLEELKAAVRDRRSLRVDAALADRLRDRMMALSIRFGVGGAAQRPLVVGPAMTVEPGQGGVEPSKPSVSPAPERPIINRRRPGMKALLVGVGMIAVALLGVLWWPIGGTDLFPRPSSSAGQPLALSGTAPVIEPAQPSPTLPSPPVQREPAALPAPKVVTTEPAAIPARTATPVVQSAQPSEPPPELERRGISREAAADKAVAAVRARADHILNVVAYPLAPMFKRLNPQGASVVEIQPLADGWKVSVRLAYLNVLGARQHLVIEVTVAASGQLTNAFVSGWSDVMRPQSISVDDLG